MRILIVGFGKIGADLGQRLSAAGHEVFALKRHAPASDTQAQWLAADVRDASSLAAHDNQFDQAYVILPPAQPDEAGYAAIYDQGVENLCRWLGHDVPMIFVSSTSVYGQQAGEWVDEASATQPTRYSGKYLLQGEQRILATNPRSIVVRFSGIYGAGRVKMLSVLMAGSEIQQDPPSYTNRIHHDDCVAVLSFLGDKQRQGADLDSLYLASDLDPAPRWEVANWLVAQGGGVMPVARRVEGVAKQNKRCNSARLQQLGFVFEYPGYRDGYQAVLDTYEGPDLIENN